MVIKSPCFDRDSLADEVEQWLGRDTADGRVTSIQIRASQGVLSFSIEVDGQPATVREFPELPRDCLEQRSALGLSIALAIDALESDLPPVMPRQELPIQISLAGALTTGIPTALGLGGYVGAEWRVTRWLGLRVGITGITSSAEQRLTDSLAVAYDTRLLSTRTDACWRLPNGDQWELAACAGFWWGELKTTSGGAFDNVSASHAWYAASVSAELRLAGNAHFGLVLGLDAIVPLRSSTQLAVLDSDGKPIDPRSFPRVLGGLRLGPTLSF